MAENNTLTLQQVVCPSCGRPIHTFNPDKLMAECPFCHSKLVNPLVTRKNVSVPERIIPFTTDESSFEKALVFDLVDQDFVPVNLFQVISTDDVIQTYLPMYLFEGTFNASWSCESGYIDQKVSSNGQTRDVKKWFPHSGNSAGNFSFLCLANESEQLPQELRDFARLFPYDVMLSKPFDPALIDYADENLMTLECTADETLIWQKYGKDMVVEMAMSTARDQLGNQEIRNFRASTSHNLTTKGRYVFVPFWFVYYNYQNKQYFFLMDGTGQRTSYNHPVDQEEVDFVTRQEKTKKIYGWLWLLSFLLMYIFNFGTGFIYFILWLIGKFFVNKFVNNKIEERLAESKMQRQIAANRLMQS